MPAIHIPASDDLVEIDLAYIAFERVVMTAFLRKCQLVLADYLGAEWAQLFYLREDHASLRQNYRSPSDPIFMLSSYVTVGESPLRALLPYSQHHRNVARTVRDNRNLWAHYQPLDQRQDILGAIANLQNFCNLLGLDDAAVAGQSITARLQEISANRVRLIRGGGPGATLPPSSSSTRAADKAEAGEQKPDALTIRPRIGGYWEYPLPSSVYELNRTYQDVLDSSGESVTKQFGSALNGAIQRWLKLPINSWLYVDLRDGATVALVDGDPHLIGYLGPEPSISDSEYRGFFIPGTYEVLDGGLVEIGSHTALQISEYGYSSPGSAIIDKLQASQGSIRITDYGDLVVVDDSGARRVGVLSTLEN